MTIPQAERESQPRPAAPDPEPFWRDPLVDKLERIAGQFRDDPRVGLLIELIDRLSDRGA
jgi:hypothetical protein